MQIGSLQTAMGTGMMLMQSINIKCAKTVSRNVVLRNCRIGLSPTNCRKAYAFITGL